MNDALHPDIIDAMLAAGASAEVIAAACRAAYALDQESKAGKRASDAQRQRRWRAQTSRHVTATSRDERHVAVTSPDSRDPPSPSSSSPVPPPITTPTPGSDSSLRSESAAAGAAAPDDLDARSRLFTEGFATLAAITGRTPDSCRSLIGRWLKLADDEAIHVLAALDDARRNRIANPTAWITARLAQRGTPGSRAPPAGRAPMSCKDRKQQEWDDVRAKLAIYAGAPGPGHRDPDQPRGPEDGGSGGESLVGLLPPLGRERS